MLHSTISNSRRCCKIPWRPSKRHRVVCLSASALVQYVYIVVKAFPKGRYSNIPAELLWQKKGLAEMRLRKCHRNKQTIWLQDPAPAIAKHSQTFELQLCSWASCDLPEAWYKHHFQAMPTLVTAQPTCNLSGTCACMPWHRYNRNHTQGLLPVRLV